MLSSVTVNVWLVEFVMVTLAFGLGCFLASPLINANVLYENINIKMAYSVHQEDGSICLRGCDISLPRG